MKKLFVFALVALILASLAVTAMFIFRPIQTMDRLVQFTRPLILWIRPGILIGVVVTFAAAFAFLWILKKFLKKKQARRLPTRIMPSWHMSTVMPLIKRITLKHWLLYSAIAIYVVAFLFVAFFVKTPFTIPTLIIVIALAFCQMVVASVKIIREQEQAVLIFFGKILENWDSGLHYALAPFFYIRKATRNSIQVDFGTLDQKQRQEIERARRSEGSQSWYVMTEPVRINWGDMRSIGGLTEKEQEMYANDPYANTMTTDPHFYFRIRIFDLKMLIEEVGGVEEALERIKVTCIRALSEMAGKSFVAKARKELDVLSGDVLARVEDLVGDPNPSDKNRSPRHLGRCWGIDVQEAAIQDIGAPHAANTALAERTAEIAKSDGLAIGKIRTATAERIRLTEEGQGKANAIIALAKAEEKRLRLEGIGAALALRARGRAVTKPGGELVLKIDALEHTMAPNSVGKTVIISPDLSSSLIGAVIGASEILKASQTQEDKKATKTPASPKTDKP